MRSSWNQRKVDAFPINYMSIRWPCDGPGNLIMFNSNQPAFPWAAHLGAGDRWKPTSYVHKIRNTNKEPPRGYSLTSAELNVDHAQIESKNCYKGSISLRNPYFWHLEILNSWAGKRANVKETAESIQYSANTTLDHRVNEVWLLHGIVARVRVR